MKYPTIKIHLGANVNNVTVDGRTFNRFSMTYVERKRFNRLVADGWSRAHEVNTQRKPINRTHREMKNAEEIKQRQAR